MKKLTKKQEKMINKINEDLTELQGMMFDKIYDKTVEGVKGWEKMPTEQLIERAICKAHEADNGCYKQIIDAANYLFFAWVKAGKP